MVATEFFQGPDNHVWIYADGKARRLSPIDKEIIDWVLLKVATNFDRKVYETLHSIYRTQNELVKRYCMAERFLLCYCGKLDMTEIDMEDGLLHHEKGTCPIYHDCPWGKMFCEPARLEISNAEMRVLRLLKKGYSHQSAADVLKLSPKTVNNHFCNAMVRTGANSRAELFALIE